MNDQVENILERFSSIFISKILKYCKMNKKLREHYLNSKHEVKVIYGAQDIV